MVAFIFAGQGAQYVGMGKDLYEAFPESKAVFDKAEEALGFELKRRCFEGPQELLKITNISQPAILTVSIAAFEALKARFDIRPSFLAGLSLGEYSALIAAGSLNLEQGLKLVRKRSEIMDEAARHHPGNMTAVLDLPLEKVSEICIKTGAEMANINCPGQIVISGGIEEVDEAKKLCLEAGARRAVDLEVSGAFHSKLMLEASVELKNVLEYADIAAAGIPVISNYTARPQLTAAEIRENLVCQMYSTVRWEDSMRFILSQGVTNFIEFGPGKVLKGLMRKIDGSVPVVSIGKRDDIINFKGI
jgi:[acyl-carrier-protein] S-malonyltransferase